MSALRIYARSAALLALVVALVVAPLPAIGQGQPHAEAAPARQQVAVMVRHEQPAYSPEATFTVGVAVDVAQRTDYLEVRLRMTSPSGRLLYQKTEVRHNVSAGRASVEFSRSLKGLGVRQGRYPIEVRVLATGSDPYTVRTRLLVLEDPSRTITPVVLVARLVSPPALDPQGRFATDPALYPRPRSDAERLLDASSRHPASPLTICAAPLLLEEWLRAADGYEVIEPGGTRSVPPEDPTAVTAAAVLRRLREAVAARRVELLDVPYAEPDVRALDAIGAEEDLQHHWALSDAVFARTGSAPASATALLASPVPSSALEQARKRKDRLVILAPGTLASGDATAGPGAYRVLEGLAALVPDPGLADPAHDDDADAFYDALFDHATSEDATSPVVALFEVGPGSRHAAIDVERALGWIEAAPWVAGVHVDEAIRDEPRRQAVPSSSAVAQPPLPPYWPEVAQAHSAARALSAALESEDDGANAALRDALIAQSTLWAGTDGTYALSERAVSYARSASERSQRIFGAVSIDAKDVTLPDVSGEIPISIVNKTDKTMRLTLQASAERASLRGVPKVVTIQPGENVVTIAVDVRGELGDRIRISLAAGDYPLASSEISVRASYLDRIVTIAGVLLFLLVLLAYIRRRAIRAEAGGTMSSGDAAEGSRPTNGS